MNENKTPFIPSSSNVAEVTLPSVLLGVLLAVLLAAANVYLGLYAGLTVSASIPAAVVSMAILRGILKTGTILENNIVATIASSGQALASGVIFTVPALLISGVWTDVQFWPTTIICVTGGLLGIMFMVPLRKSFIVEDKSLTFPEGVACAEVLKAGEQGGAAAKYVLSSVVFGALIKFLTNGVSIFKGSVEAAWGIGQSAVYLGVGVSPALLGVGYIVGLNIACLVFIGGAIAWLVAIPIYAPIAGLDPDLVGSFWRIWSKEIRFLGVGAMIVGGLSSLINVRHGISKGLSEAMMGYKKAVGEHEVLRTDRNIKHSHLLAVLGISVVMVFFLYRSLTGSFAVAMAATFCMTLMSFFFVAVATYIAGLLGTSNSPVSGMTICAVLATGFFLMALGMTGTQGIIATLGVAGVVCCAACSAGDASQDLKCGHLLGATPKHQQWMEVIGTVIPAFVMAPVMVVLHHSYGIGTGQPTSLKAPQATLFASLVKGLFGQGAIPWNFVAIGAGIAIVVLLLDHGLRARGYKFRMPVMAVAVGMYLPLTLSLPIFLGGLIAQFSKNRDESGPGILFASGLIAGEAIIGIIIGGAIYFNKNAFPITLISSDALSLVGVIVPAFLLFTIGRSRKTA